MIRDFFIKVFTDFWNLKFWIIWLPVTCVILGLFYLLWSISDNVITRQQQDSFDGSAEQIGQTDGEHSLSVSEKSEVPRVVTPQGSPVDSTPDSSSHPHPHPASPHGTDPIKGTSDVPFPKLLSGLYKGMTPEEAQSRIEKGAALDLKLRAYLDKQDTFTDAVLQTVDDDLSLMLSVFRLLSPEQLEQARVEALKTFPAKEVDTFFDEVANEGITKTPQEIARDAQHILSSRETQEIVRRNLANEWNEIQQGYKDFYGVDVYESKQQAAAARIERKLASEDPDLLEAIRRSKQ